MDDKEFLSAGLWRPIKSGNNYSRLIKGTSCKKSSLSTGDTFVTIQHMYDWVQKHQHQTERLAPLLKGNSLRTTAANIYKFLYDHIQYKADGTLQVLKSPGCAWASREADCKTYSIFASSILTNLGIQHAIRQVAQPGYFPDEYTHVYVVIPENQNLKKLNGEKIIVIDATRHENTEVTFLKKHDTLMLPHQGLSAPKPSKALCSFSGRSLRTGNSHAIRKSAGKKLAACRGLNGTPVRKIVEDLNKLVNVLAMAGIPKAQAQKIQDQAMVYISAGKDPNFKIEQSGILVGTNFIPFFPSGLQKPGLGIDPVTLGLISSLASGSGEGGESGGSPLSGIFASLNIAENFNLVTKYGLSSWGASTSPEKVKQEFQAITIPEVEKILQGINTDPQRAINEAKFYLDFIEKFREYLRDNHSRAESTRLANDAFAGFARELKAQMIDPVIQKLKASGVQVSEVSYTPTGTFRFADSNLATKSASQLIPMAPKYGLTRITGYQFTVPQSLKNQLATSAPTSGSWQQSPTGSGSQFPTTTGNNYKSSTGSLENGPAKAGFGLLPVLLIAGAGLGLYLSNKKKGMSTSQKSSK